MKPRSKVFVIQTLVNLVLGSLFFEIIPYIIEKVVDYFLESIHT